MKHPILFSSVRSFFIALFGTVGVLCGFIFLIIALVFILSDDKTYSSNVKLRPDAEGNRKELSSTAPVLLELHIDGTIGSENLTADKVEEALLCSREGDFASDRVKGILLVINSPGGSAIDSDVIYRHLMQYKERHKVPIHAYVSGLCASGGYYIACAAEKISTSDVSMIGSIGVISWPPYFNISQVMEKVGVNSMTLTAGKGKDELNPFRPWKEGEQKSHQEILDFLYDRFVTVVSKSRPLLTKEKLNESLGANVFPAPVALKLGYIDEYSILQSDAIAQLAKAAELTEKYQVVMLQTKTWWQKAIEEKSPLINGVMRHQVSLPAELTREQAYPYSYRYIP